MIIGFFVMFFLLRLLSLAVSIRHEKQLLAVGAKQYGARNSKVLAMAHIAYYVLALVEAQLSGAQFDGISALGAGLTVLAVLALYWVIRTLGGLWTLKIYIHPQHQINRSWLFRVVKHPNYFLNIIPELIGIGLLCHAWTVMLVGLPIYGVILWIRINQEQAAMRHLF